MDAFNIRRKQSRRLVMHLHADSAVDTSEFDKTVNCKIRYDSNLINSAIAFENFRIVYTIVI